MELRKKNSLSNKKRKHFLIRSTLLIGLWGLGANLFAVPVTSGQLVIINGLGNSSTTGNVGTSASSISVVVSDSTGPCSTISSVVYNGTAVIKWSSTAVHSATVCTGISSVAITPLKTMIGTISTIVYDSVNTTTVPALTATAPITYLPPTTAYANLSLIVTGAGVPASSVPASATVWGVGAATAPVFDVGNGSLTNVGVPGGIGAGGLKAEKVMRRYAVIPM
ncbi:hypothetical protein [Legionella maioricensis]|uniref:Uncharacterized protein n=1 Tax=Legionella maioricensis TaxID=2896528 RepID=A0A9X2D1F1_9GAMM|nr:hypothetical protein [Legionella maioricensis]MCL9684584.1 hypothetical protein [Legionella maioricensis]MCL9687364.1 hypothetical protein [Legionella maioricensis]